MDWKGSNALWRALVWELRAGFQVLGDHSAAVCMQQVFHFSGPQFPLL